MRIQKKHNKTKLLHILVCLILIVAKKGISQNNALLDRNFETAFNTRLFNEFDLNQMLKSSYPIEKELTSSHGSSFKLLTCNGKKCRKKTKQFKEVTFSYNNIEYKVEDAYVSYGRSLHLNNSGDIYYKDSNLIFRSKFIDKKGNSVDNYFYPDGSLMSSLSNRDNSFDSFNLTLYDKNGDIKTTITSPALYERKKNDKYERYNTDYSQVNYHKVISSKADNSVIITHPDSTIYKGYGFIGNYFNKDGYEITGYLGLANSQYFGGGTVAFLHHLPTNKFYWSIIIDNEIVLKYPALKSEKPDIHELQKNTNVDFKDILLGTQYALKEIWENGGDNHGVECLLNMSSKNFSRNYSGYGVKVVTNDSVKAGIGNDRFFEVGIYENGKLNGPGYRLKMDFDFVFQKQYYIQPKEFILKVEAGEFKDGILVKGHKKEGKVRTLLFIDNNLSWLKPQPIDGLDYSFKIDKSKNTDRSVYYSSDSIYFKNLKPNDFVYVPRINRYLRVYGIDIMSKVIYLKLDHGYITYNPMIHGKLLKKDLIVSNYSTNPSCYYCEGKGIVVKPIYQTVEKKHTYETGEMSILTNRGVARGNKKYTATWTQKEKIGEETTNCNVCSGKGSRTFNFTSEYYELKKVTF